MIRHLLILLVIASGTAHSQTFAPVPGMPGSTAIHKDSSIIVNWATGVQILRGPQDVQNQSSSEVSYGIDQDALSVADNYPVSLGDGGKAILTFPNYIKNGPGPDFAVFENGFADNYMELAFVEVSSDGINFFRFDAVSEAPTDIQYWNASFSDCRYVHNLAGKYRVFHGTPFDLNELSGIPGLDINMISHVRIIDVVGSIDPTYGSYDSHGTIINDPFPTPFESGGFDLDAVAVLNQSELAFVEEIDANLNVSPNPFNENLVITSEREGKVNIVSSTGKAILSTSIKDQITLNLGSLLPGVYFLSFTDDQKTVTQRIFKY